MIRWFANHINASPFMRNSIVLFSGAMAANVLNYVFHLVLGRMVGVSTYGEIESVIALTNIISVPAMTLTLIATKHSAGNKADNDPKSSRALFGYLNKKIFQFGTPLFLGVLIFSPWVRDFLNLTSLAPIVLLWIIMFVSFLGAVASGILFGWQKFKQAGLIGVWGAGVKLVAGIVLVAIGFGTSGAIGSFVLAGIVSYVVALIMLRFIFHGDNQAYVRTQPFDFSALRPFVLPAFFGTLAITMLGNVDMVFAKHHLGEIAAGEYGALTGVSKIIFFATGVIAIVLFPMSAERNHKKEDSFRTFSYAALLMLFLSACAIIAYAFFPSLILSLLFGQKYVGVANHLAWFAVLAVLYSFANLFLQYLLSSRAALAAALVFLVCAIGEAAILFFLGGSLYAILTVAIITQFCAMIGGLFLIARTRRTIDIPA